MNDLKIKVWYPHQKRMVGPYTPNEWSRRLPSNVEEIGKILRFTGLFDKNGDEVYEGDIFLIDNVILFVVFEDGKFCFDNTGGSYGRDFLGQDRIGRLTIAGNAHSTPELLDQSFLDEYFKEHPPFDNDKVTFDEWLRLFHIKNTTCNCGGEAKLNHPLGKDGCLRKIATGNLIPKYFRKTCEVNGIEITEYTLLKQRLYHYHGHGIWSLPKSEDSINSLPDNT